MRQTSMAAESVDTRCRNTQRNPEEHDEWVEQEEESENLVDFPLFKSTHHPLQRIDMDVSEVSQIVQQQRMES